MAVFAGPEIENSGLILHLDAANSKSYPATGSSWFSLLSNTLTASLINTPTWTGSSFVFDGTNQECTVSATSLNITWSVSTQRTLEIWFRYLSYPPVVNGLTIWGDQAGTNGTLRTFGGASSGKFAWTWDDSSAITSQKTMSLNEWAQVVIVLQGYDATYYVNGQLDTAQFTSTDLGVSSNTIWRIARDGRWNSYVNIEVSRALQYNRILTAVEIAQNFNAFRSRHGI